MPFPLLFPLLYGIYAATVYPGPGRELYGPVTYVFWFTPHLLSIYHLFTIHLVSIYLLYTLSSFLARPLTCLPDRFWPPGIYPGA
jgi:hypothetical protein